MNKFTKKAKYIAAVSGLAVLAVFTLLLISLVAGREPARAALESVATPAAAMIREQEAETSGETAFTGWKVEAGIQRYYEDGKTVGSCWVGDYYLNDADQLAKDVFVVWKGGLYHVDEHGKVNRGRFSDGEKEYYANEDGLISFSTWILHGQEWLYLSEDGSILKNGVTPDGYLMDVNGEIVDDGYAEYAEFQYSDKNLRLNLGAGDLIWKYLKKRGWTNTAIAGMLGNFQQESHLSPSLIESNGIGYGLGQWSFGRRAGLEAYAKSLGKPVNDIYMQLDYLMVEPGESSYVRTYMKTDFSSAAEAAIAWCNDWERPNKAKARLASVRIPYAMAYYGHYVDGVKYMESSYSMEDPVYLDDENETAEDQENSEYTPLTDASGNPTIGWIYDAGGWWYRYENGDYAADQWVMIDGEWYYFGADGYMESGQWITDRHGMNYQLDEEGHIIPSEEAMKASAASAVITAGVSGGATPSDARENP
ncbi:MAG: phage tail tip lysozyme [Lachnospiraceae bacterium]|nr:phage tail tip lysozyme [Lachnospiraceae bacterium]